MDYVLLPPEVLRHAKAKTLQSEAKEMMRTRGVVRRDLVDHLPLEVTYERVDVKKRGAGSFIVPNYSHLADWGASREEADAIVAKVMSQLTLLNRE